ncbi:unnamed protein product [Auanema sp. JU1783]|nr:unnamed protein product [Auanema sp. JU1783]
MAALNTYKYDEDVMTSARERGLILAKENPHIVMAFRIYRKAVQFQMKDDTKTALGLFSVLVAYMGTDPYIWIRMTECSLDIMCADYKKWSKQSRPNFKPVLVDPVTNNGIFIVSEKEPKVYETGNVNLALAESYIATAMTLLNASTDVDLKMKVKNLAAFVAMKRRRFEVAVGYAKTVLEKSEGEYNEVKRQALMVTMESRIYQGRYEDVKDMLSLELPFSEDTEWKIWKAKCYSHIGLKDEAAKIIEELKDYQDRMDVYVLSLSVFKKTKQEENLLNLIS